MKARILLADAAVLNSDGTFGVLRGGITHVWGEVPVPFRGSLLAQLEFERGDKGSHSLDLRCMNQDGAELIPEMRGQFDAPPGGGVTNILLNLQVAFPAFGIATFILRIDNVEVDRWNLTIMKPQPKPGAPS